MRLFRKCAILIRQGEAFSFRTLCQRLASALGVCVTCISVRRLVLGVWFGGVHTIGHRLRDTALYRLERLQALASLKCGFSIQKEAPQGITQVQYEGDINGATACWFR